MSPLPSFRHLALAAVALAALAVVPGCHDVQATPSQVAPTEVLVSQATQGEITDYEVFTGRTVARKTVEVRARVTGYLETIHFKDGDEVQEGDLLFTIDPRQYQAELDRTEAALEQAEARYKRLEADLTRARSTFSRGAISRSDLDLVAGDYAEAKAALGMARAARDLAKLNVEFTRVTAPIAGRLSRRLVDEGNLVKADETLLTTIVTPDPMYAYFDVNEETLLRIRRLIREGKIGSRTEAAVPVEAALADEEDFAHRGTIDFSDNTVDPSSGTLKVRGVLANPIPPGRPPTARILSPGLFVRVRLPIGPPHQAVMVDEQALGTDQGRKFVYVVNDEDKVVYRPVTVGAANGKMRVITAGLQPGERVVVSEQQRIRPGVKVLPRPAEGLAGGKPTKGRRTQAVGEPAKAKAAPPVVLAAQPVEGEVTDYEYFTGRTVARKTVEVRARVTGYLETIHFKDGDEVQEGDLLFTIDPRQYQAELDRTEAALEQAEARYKRLEADLTRARSTFSRGAISRSDLDLVAGDYAEAKAALGMARAARDLAKLNVEFTRVTAPIAGRLSRRLVDEGNLVKADETLLTTIVTLDPMYVYFDVDERTLLRIRRLIREGKIRSRAEGAVIPIEAALADEDYERYGYPHRGTLDFSDNAVDPNTGTLKVRGVIDNPAPRVLSPGLFLRVRLPIGAPHKSLMIAEQALGTDRGRKFVYVVRNEQVVVGKDGKKSLVGEVEQRYVTIGTQSGGMRVIQEGLQPGEHVIVSGLQRARRGAKVTVEIVGEPAVRAPAQALARPTVIIGPTPAKGSE
ncbi:MAG: efflux RND transporter periplasmic adaptor subunit [Isosphaeraceae bacterium]|nr:efflux RND transporter periplasmic adaptor subunit [Isosphaeraceae bacterium]